MIHTAGLLILCLYFVLTILLGWIAKQRGTSANDFLNATRSLPLWVVSAAFLAANCGALEIVGLSAMATQFGVQAFHFYWIGAIPGMVFLGLWMMPVYRKSGIRSIPEFLRARYGRKVQTLNACIVAFMMLMLSGISLYAIAQVLRVVLGLGYATSVLVSGSVVLIYVLLGGVRATIYNEVFQLLVMVVGLAPLMFKTIGPALQAVHGTDMRTHVWSALPTIAPRQPLDRIGVIFGLGLILSFSYWGTDFVLMQRALAANGESEARQVPLWAAFGKLGFAFLVIIPGLAARVLLPRLGAEMRFDQALPTLMTMYYGPVTLGLGLTALVASLMSGLAANVSAFAAIWTGDLYRATLRPNQSEEHYLSMGRFASVFAVAAAMMASSITMAFSNLMEHVQLIFSLFSAPFWAIFLLGMTSRRITARGALAGLASGTGLAIVHHFCVLRHWLEYGSVMTANFYVAIYGFTVTAVTAWLVSLWDSDWIGSDVLIFRWRAAREGSHVYRIWILAAILLIACGWLNYVWR